jgi:hypothetical protein
MTKKSKKDCLLLGIEHHLRVRSIYGLNRIYAVYYGRPNPMYYHMDMDMVGNPHIRLCLSRYRISVCTVLASPMYFANAKVGPLTTCISMLQLVSTAYVEKTVYLNRPFPHPILYQFRDGAHKPPTCQW